MSKDAWIRYFESGDGIEAKYVVLNHRPEILSLTVEGEDKPTKWAVRVDEIEKALTKDEFHKQERVPI